MNSGYGRASHQQGESGFYAVTAVWAHEDPVVVLLTIEGETLETTPNHPFYTAVGEWVQAGSLQPGDEIRDAAWGTGVVEAITFLATPQVMYNFTVATAHTYFIGDGQWLVHNDCPFDDLVNLRKELNLPPAGSLNDASTLARLDINGRAFYGINGHGQSTSFGRVNPITQTHAEADAVQQAINAGLGGQGGRVTMYVDRAPCPACGRNNGIGSLARELGVDQIEVIWPGGSQIFAPTR